LTIFKNSSFGEVRTTIINGEPYFIGKEVATILGYKDTAKAIKAHVDKEDFMVGDLSTIKGTRVATFINESGLYSLILSSKLPQAKEFKRWVTSEVLPAIRKQGGYMVTTTDMTDEEIMARAILVADEAIKRRDERIRQMEQETEKQEQVIQNKNQQILTMANEIQDMTPKANYYDMILNNKSTVLTTQIALDYGLTAKAFNQKLYDLRIQHKVNDQWILYSPYITMGYMHSKPVEITKHDGRRMIKYNSEWTQKGRLFLYDLLKKHNILPLIEMEE
jgi:prophage antirepressor-like protein